MLEDAKNIVLTGEWKHLNAGGSHLHSEDYVKGNDASWQLNPKYLLVLKGEGRADVQISLSRPKWKFGEKKADNKSPESEKKKSKTIIGCMLGVYIFENRGQKVLKKSDAKEDVTFYPKNEVVINKTLECKESGYIIMPCTFEDQQEGAFILSVSSSNDFVFKEYTNE